MVGLWGGWARKLNRSEKKKGSFEFCGYWETSQCRVWLPWPCLSHFWSWACSGSQQGWCRQTDRQALTAADRGVCSCPMPGFLFLVGNESYPSCSSYPRECLSSVRTARVDFHFSCIHPTPLPIYDILNCSNNARTWAKNVFFSLVNSRRLRLKTALAYFCHWQQWLPNYLLCY